MRISIAKKITFLFILLIIILSTSIGIYSLKIEKQALLSEFDDRAKTLINSLSVSSEAFVLFHDTEMLSKIGLGALSQKDVVFCEIRDKNKKVLFRKGTKDVEPSPIKRWGKECVQEYTAFIYTEKMEDDAFGEELILGVKGKKEKIGRIYLTFSLDSIRNKLKNIQQTIGCIIIIGIVLGSLLIALLVRIVLGIPINTLVADTRVIAGGNLDHVVPILTNDEIGSLTAAFNQMTKDLKTSQKRLINAEKLAAAAQIASEAAHEIRNPLQVIITGIYLLKKIISIEENPMVLQTINQMDGAVSRATNFTDDLLHFARPISLKMDMVNINDMIKIALSELPENILSGIEVKLELADDIPKISADFDRLKQVVINLVKNAAEAMEEVKSEKLKVKSEEKGEKVRSKRLEVRSEKERDFIKIHVSDNGKGIPEEELSKIFDPFHTGKTKGIGLGLSICKRFVEAHDNSRIEVESEPGKGTRFVVWLGRV
ncbi:HAMP domain-containing protein [Candidatus Desantisbacteria bacterium]|nr:HAMP domain-containing protein [Candidatus Desantisbacteria bacterium]